MCWHKRIRFLTTTTDENYLIDGVNVFAGFDTEKTCMVRDPLYKKRHEADIYEVKGKTKTFKVAIVEFTVCVYGIYLIEK